MVHFTELNTTGTLHPGENTATYYSFSEKKIYLPVAVK